jgi:hypothetical protein
MSTFFHQIYLIEKLSKADLHFASLNNMCIRETIALYEEVAKSDITSHS